MTRLMMEPDHLWKWLRRVEQEFQHRNLTRGERDALMALRHFWIEGEDCFPAEATLALRARCSVRTVRRAKAKAQTLELLSWQQRRKLVGGRWRRDSNTYTLMIPQAEPSMGQKDGGKYLQRSTRGVVPMAVRSARQQLALLGTTPDDLARVRAISAARWASWPPARRP